MPSCSAITCRNKHKDGVRLFRWPSAPERARLWLENCGRAGSGWQPKPSSRLCEKHFDSSQFEEHRQDGWRKLKPNAVPTLFVNDVDDCRVRRRSRATKSQQTVTSHEQGPQTTNECGIAGDVLRQTANLTTDLKVQKQELLYNVVLDLQVCGDQDTDDVEPDTSSGADQSCHVSEKVESCHAAHLKYSDSKQDMNKACYASDTIQDAESCPSASHSREHSYACSQRLRRQTVYQCPLCARLTMSLKLLINHLAKHRLQNECQSQLQSIHRHCTACGKEFSCAAVLASHIRVVHRGMKARTSRNSSKSTLLPAEASRHCLLCAVCGRQFVHVGAFQRHSRSHLSAGDRCFLCSVCGHRSATAAALRRHSAVHVAADRRPLACAHCDRRFVRAGDLRKHVRVHTGDRPYQCSVCGRSFSRTYSLLSHGRTHAAKSALRPCLNCRRTFRSAAGLAVHRRFCLS